MLTAKLLVPLGAPLQLRPGETLPPVQPNPLNTCSLAMVPPSLISELVRLKLCAFATLTPNALTPSAAIQIASFFIAFLPLMSRALGQSRTHASLSNFRDVMEVSETTDGRLT